MSFGTAISTCFSKYAVFSGRARRSEFWYWMLFHFIVVVITTILDKLLGTHINFTKVGDTTYASAYSPGWITTVAVLALLLPSIAVAVRRLHDTDRSGWWWWVGAICFIGQIILVVFFVGDSTPDNRYGPNPKTATPPA